MIDNGILNLFLINPETKLLETIVHNKLKRDFKDEVFYFKDNYEIDFYIPEKQVIQVSYSIKDEKTRNRVVLNGYIRQHPAMPGTCPVSYNFV